MTFSGMTPDQIDLASGQLRTQARELQTIRAQVTRLMNDAAANWNGQDLRTFRSTWQNSYLPKMLAAISCLESMASELAQQATQQRTASAASTLPGVAAIFIPLDFTSRGGQPSGGPTPASGDLPDSPTDRRGNTEPTSPVSPGNGLGDPEPGTTPVHPNPPPWPEDRDRSINVDYGTKERTSESDALYTKMRAAALAAGLKYPDAAANLQHYFQNNGTDQKLNVDSMLLTGFEGKVNEQRISLATDAINQAKTSGATGPVTFPINTKWREYSFSQSTDPNWFLAVGSMSYSQQGYVTVYPPQNGHDWSATISTQVSVFDVYNWDNGKSTNIPFIGVVTDADMKDFMHEGRAMEYNMYGTSSVYESGRLEGGVYVPK